MRFEDAAAQIAFYFLQDSGAAIGQMEDACGFAGDGTSTFGGMRGICPTLIDGAHGAGAVNAGSGHSTFGQLDTSDISSLMAALPDKYWPNCKFYVSGYGAAQTLAKVLQMCGDDLTRANVMKQAASLKDFEPDTLLPGVKINTSATDFAPISQLQMQRFKGEKWELFGPVFSGDVTN